MANLVDTTLLRFLEIVKRELGAADAYLQAGGREPDLATQIWCWVPGDFKLVAVFAGPDFDRASAKQKLELLARSFQTQTPENPELAQPEYALGLRRVDEQLVALCARSGALCAIVVDAQSPVIWGSSVARDFFGEVDAVRRLSESANDAEAAGRSLLELSNLSGEEQREFLSGALLSELKKRSVRQHLEQLSRFSLEERKAAVIIAQATADVLPKFQEHAPSSHFRAVSHDAQNLYFVRSFASIYAVILAFDTDFSELVAEGSMLHALPVLERLVLALPPVEPPPRGGRVIRLPLPRQNG